VGYGLLANLGALLKYGWRGNFLADQNQRVSKPSQITVQWDNRSALRFVLRMGKLVPSEKYV